MTNVAEMNISRYDRVQNTVGKEENAAYQHFFPFPTVFSKAFFFKVVKKSGLCGKELINSFIKYKFSPQPN